MNNLPLDGELIPSCEGDWLVEDNKSEFYYFMRSFVAEDLKGKLGRDLLLYPGSEDANAIDNIMSNYTVLAGGYYTTTLSFALNGVVPDDMNNNFTNMKMAVIEPIKEQVDADFVTIETIDTTVRGKMKMSDKSILVIESDFFSKLTQEEQENLMLNFKIRFFEGSLRSAVNETLIENNYPVLPLVQNREMRNIGDCPEKTSMLAFEDRFSVEVGASRSRLQYLTYMYGGGTEIDKIAHDKISSEHNNTLIVEEYYRKQLCGFMLDRAEDFGLKITDEERFYLFTNTTTGNEVMKKVTTSLIAAYGGLENFQNFINDYNQYAKDNYLTNKEIVSQADNKKM